MTVRQDIEREIEEKLAEGESAYAKLKAKLEVVGDDIGEETREAVHAAGKALDQGKAKLKQLAAASDAEFDKLWAESKDEWHDLKGHISSGWSQFSHAVRNLLS